jgi:hypothetical protein
MAGKAGGYGIQGLAGAFIPWISGSSPASSACRWPKPRTLLQGGRPAGARHEGPVIALGEIDGREAAALMVDGRLEDLAIGRPTPPPGAILRGIVGRPVKGLGGVFVDLPAGARVPAPDPRLAPGQPVLVQVAGAAEPGKAVPVTTRLLVKGRYAILTPGAPGMNVSRRIRDEDRCARADRAGPRRRDAGADRRSA